MLVSDILKLKPAWTKGGQRTAITITNIDGQFVVIHSDDGALTLEAAMSIGLERQARNEETTRQRMNEAHEAGRRHDAFVVANGQTWQIQDKKERKAARERLANEILSRTEEVAK